MVEILTNRKQLTTMKTKIKTIDITALNWLDKVNGNSYFAATAIINYQLKGEQRIILPFQYGYGDQYIHEAAKEMDAKGFIKLERYKNGSNKSLWQYCEENKIILRTTKYDNCKKSELKDLH
jgi:hypothetical protein